jgi:transcriptional regulator with XRE-family HTH domain
LPLQSHCGTAALGTETKGSDQVLPVQCRMARAAIGLSVRKLAAAAKVSPETVIRFERGEKLRKRTVDSLRQVLEAAGLEFTDGRKPGVRVSANLGR